MDLTACEKCVLEYVLLSEPSSKDMITTIGEFARMVGQTYSGEELREAVASLTLRRLIIEVTPEIAASILKDLDGVHGPLLSISEFPHYSVTPSGGNARLAYCPLGDPQGLGGHGAVAVEHFQFFTPLEALADQLASRTVFSGDKLGVFNVYLAPNNDDANGFIVDVLADPDAENHPFKLEYEHKTLLQHELAQSYGMHSNQAFAGLTHSDVWSLIRLSGNVGSPAFHSVGRGDAQPLLEMGLVRELQKPEANQLNERLESLHSIMFGPQPRYRMRVLSDAGKDRFFQILDAVPSLKQHFVASRVVGEYVHRYFATVDEAIEARNKLKESGKTVTNIERIGKWSYYWWKVHLEGARFSYWNDDIL